MASDPQPAQGEAPRITDAVVVNGTKYRIRSFAGGHAICRTSFGNQWVKVETVGLSWDKRAGVWRVPPGWVQVHHHAILDL